jgi:hypothetical protein
VSKTNRHPADRLSVYRLDGSGTVLEDFDDVYEDILDAAAAGKIIPCGWTGTPHHAVVTPGRHPRARTRGTRAPPALTLPDPHETIWRNGVGLPRWWADVASHGFEWEFDPVPGSGV